MCVLISVLFSFASCIMSRSRVCGVYSLFHVADFTSCMVIVVFSQAMYNAY